MNEITGHAQFLSESFFTIKSLRNDIQMRDYTYLDNGRFWITKIYRTRRFDIGRLDINQITNHENSDFVRGFRMVVNRY